MQEEAGRKLSELAHDVFNACTDLETDCNDQTFQAAGKAILELDQVLSRPKEHSRSDVEVARKSVENAEHSVQRQLLRYRRPVEKAIILAAVCLMIGVGALDPADLDLSVRLLALLGAALLTLFAALEPDGTREGLAYLAVRLTALRNNLDYAKIRAFSKQSKRDAMDEAMDRFASRPREPVEPSGKE